MENGAIWHCSKKQRTLAITTDQARLNITFTEQSFSNHWLPVLPWVIAGKVSGGRSTTFYRLIGNQVLFQGQSSYIITYKCKSYMRRLILITLSIISTYIDNLVIVCTVNLTNSILFIILLCQISKHAASCRKQIVLVWESWAQHSAINKHERCWATLGWYCFVCAFNNCMPDINLRIWYLLQLASSDANLAKVYLNKGCLLISLPS